MTCSDCNAQYIGQTARELGVRVAEHTGKTTVSKNGTEIQALIKGSVLAYHVLDTGHIAYLKYARVLRSNVENSIARLFAEAKSQTAMIKVKGINLSTIWEPIICLLTA